VKKKQHDKIHGYKRRKKEGWREKGNEKRRVKEEGDRKTYIEREYGKSVCFRINLKMICTGRNML
jgi:hypothetical protein